MTTEEIPPTPETPPTGDVLPTEDVVTVSGEPTEPTPPAPAPAPKIIPVPTSAMKRIKREERDRGRMEARKEFDDQAAKLGFTSYEQMMTALQEQGANQHVAAEPSDDDDDLATEPEPTVPAPQPVTKTSKPSSEFEKLRRENRKLLSDQRKLTRARVDDERKAEALQQEIDNQAADHEMRLAALQCGVGDVDYAVTCLRRDLRTKSAEELAKFDESVYFKDLLKKRPYLGRTETRNANSSPAPGATGSNGGAPAPASTTPTADDAQIDARTMSQEAFAKLLRSRGLTLPSVGMPS